MSVGLDPDYSPPAFQTQIIMSINTAFMELNQLGVGPKEGFRILDGSEEWESFIGDSINLEAIKTYVQLRTRLIFDPPLNSFLVDAIKEQIRELQFRLLIQGEEGGNKSD